MRVNLGEEEHPEIGLIALIDCIFFLLIFFMMATSFKHGDNVKHEELPVTLPKAQASFNPATAAKEALDIGVDKDGRLYHGNQRISTQALHNLLKNEAKANPDRPIRVNGDVGARYQHIVQVLELCQFEGFTQISMRVRK
jgi:biopolymer transport protein ExbD